MIGDRFLQSREVLADAGIMIIELDSPALEFEIATSAGSVAIMTDIYRFEKVLILDRLHVTGEGLNIAIIRRVAKLLGEVEDVEEVIIQGGDRQSGANRRSSPMPIRVRVR